MSSKKPAKGRKSTKSTQAIDLVSGDVLAPAVDQSKFVFQVDQPADQPVAQDTSDVVFHHIGSGEPSVPATVTAVIAAPKAADPAPLRVRHNPRFGIALGLIAGGKLSNRAIRELITTIGESRKDVRRFFSKAEPRRIPESHEIKAHRAHLIVVGEQLADDDTETREYLARIAKRLHDRLTAGESYSDDELSAVVSRYSADELQSADTLPADVPEFALAELLAAQ